MRSDRDDANHGFMEQNRRNWDDRAGLHAQPTTGYALDRFRNDPDRLSDVVAFDRRYLGLFCQPSRCVQRIVTPAARTVR